MFADEMEDIDRGMSLASKFSTTIRKTRASDRHLTGNEDYFKKRSRRNSAAHINPVTGKTWSLKGQVALPRESFANRLMLFSGKDRE